MEFCPKCGFSFPDKLAISDKEDLNFCPKCGKKLDGFKAFDGPADDLESQVVKMLRGREFIPAVKHAREETGRGLKESRDYVVQVAKRNNISYLSTPMTGKGRFFWYLLVAGFIGLMICSAGLAIYPKIGLVAKPFLCDGELSIRSSRLYTPPGRADYSFGVGRSFHCADESPRTGSVFLISTVIYTLILMVLFYLRRLYKIIRGDP